MDGQVVIFLPFVYLEPVRYNAGYVVDYLEGSFTINYRFALLFFFFVSFRITSTGFGFVPSTMGTRSCSFKRMNTLYFHVLKLVPLNVTVLMPPSLEVSILISF